MKQPTRAPILLFAALFIVLGSLAAACNGGDDEDATVVPPSITETPSAETPSPTPAPPTPTPTPEGPLDTDCPIEAAVCTLAGSIEAALESGNYDAVVELMAAREETCPGGAPAGAGGPFPLCEDATAGEVRSGYVVARRYSEGAVVSAAGLRDSIEGFVTSLDAGASDDYGSGALRLVAVSCAEPAGDGCGRATIIFSGLQDMNAQVNREVLVFWLDLPIATPQTPLDSVWTGLLLPDEMPIVLEDGGELFDLGEVHVLEE